MRDRPRRTLLSGISASLVGTAAGCLSVLNDTDETPSEESDASDDPFADLLAAVPADTADESAALSAVRESRLRNADVRDLVGPYDITRGTGLAELFAGDTEAVSRHVTVIDEGLESPFVTVFETETGDFDPERDVDAALESELTTREHDAGTDYEFAPLEDEGVVAALDDVGIVADSASTVDAAIAARDGDAPAVRDAVPTFDEGLAAFADADIRTVTTDDEWSWAYDDLEPEDGAYAILAATVSDPDTLEIHHGLSLVDESLVTDDLVDRFRAQMRSGGREIVSTGVDGSLLTATVEIDLAAERHESPDRLEAGKLDADEQYVEIEVGTGDPTPVDELSLELDGEPYDEQIWADGRDEIEGGDALLVATEDAEPFLRISLSHEGDRGMPAHTTLHADFEWTVDYDLDARTLSVRYGDEFPLDGDHVILALYDADDADAILSEPVRTTRPWTGTDLSTGDGATLENVPPKTVVYVCWKEPTRSQSLASDRIQPIGEAAVDYEYETRTATVELAFEDDRTRPAAEYTVLRDGEPAATQWRDGGKTVSDGDTLELAGVPVGTTISVVWGANDLRIGSGEADSSVSFDLTVENGTVTLVHDGGRALPVSELVAEVHIDDEEIDVPLDERTDGPFSPGDTVTLIDELERDDPPLKVRVVRDGEYIDDAYDGEL